MHKNLKLKLKLQYFSDGGNPEEKVPTPEEKVPTPEEKAPTPEEKVPTPEQENNPNDGSPSIDVDNLFDGSAENNKKEPPKENQSGNFFDDIRKNLGVTLSDEELAKKIIGTSENTDLKNELREELRNELAKEIREEFGETINSFKIDKESKEFYNKLYKQIPNITEEQKEYIYNNTKDVPRNETNKEVFKVIAQNALSIVKSDFNDVGNSKKPPNAQSNETNFDDVIKKFNENAQATFKSQKEKLKL